ncbi:MAG: PTS sugar transporter subunit IIB [Bradymonadia bacterium]
MNPFYRIDNRLVHGQIIATWMPKLRLERIVIISDTVPDNDMQMSLFGMCVPPQITFDAFKIKEGAQWLTTRRYGRSSTLVLMEGPEQAAGLFKNGHPFPTLNIGNVHHTPGSREFTSAVHLNDAQLEKLSALMRRGVKVEIQSLPTDNPINLKHAMSSSHL